MMRLLLLLFVAGGVGTLLRFGIVRGFGGPAVDGFPWGTLVANCLGSLLCGTVYGLAQVWQWSPEWRTVILVGFLGALTTFSALALETALLARGDRLALAVGYVLATNASGIGCLVVGLGIARAFGTSSL